MPPQRVTKDSTIRKRSLLKRTGPEYVVMRLCENCSRQGKECRVDSEFDKCVKCLRLGRKCDLIFSTVEWQRVKAERDRVLNDLLSAHRKIFEVNIQMQKTVAKVSRLQT